MRWIVETSATIQFTFLWLLVVIGIGTTAHLQLDARDWGDDRSIVTVASILLLFAVYWLHDFEKSAGVWDEDLWARAGLERKVLASLIALPGLLIALPVLLIVRVLVPDGGPLPHQARRAPEPFHPPPLEQSLGPDTDVRSHFDSRRSSVRQSARGAHRPRSGAQGPPYRGPSAATRHFRL